MKNFILSSAAFFAFAVLGTNTLSAQSSSNEATTTVNINLQDVISIDAGSVAAGGVVDFNYTNTTDYNNDKTVGVKNSLVVTSSKAFDVKV
ncbi:peptidoglycan-binding protein LysM, partial [Chryseobacterium salipaludis]|nr:peptidoglycan-binding protein LysM [Chryseobacterium salipaludis]MCJ8498923.1 peptidoglycan-binding protein LysM [Chryseobacterium salipaludis]